LINVGADVKKFTTKQLFTLTDGRLSTEVGEVYEILNFITGESLYTHHLPVALRFLNEVMPTWLVQALIQLKEIKAIAGDDFQDLMNYIDENYSDHYFEVHPLTEEQKEGFGEYMVGNSLLNTIGSGRDD